MASKIKRASERQPVGGPEDAALLDGSHLSADARSSEFLDQDRLALGERIRALRKSRGLSLQLLSERSGLSIASISQIERGVSSPSMRSLRLVASAFGLPVAGLFKDPAQLGDAGSTHVLRQSQRRLLTVANTGLWMELLTADEKLNLRAYYTYMAPGGSSGSDPDSHKGSETGIIVTGQMDLWLDDKKYRLNPGDSFCFDSLTPHRYSNPGESMMTAFWVVSGLEFFEEAPK
jgi:transcriptional regulator with XRE-family HTH domain